MSEWRTTGARGLAVPALTQVRERQFVDDYEMAEIRTNKDLLERLKRGSADAKARRGTFVE